MIPPPAVRTSGCAVVDRLAVDRLALPFGDCQLALSGAIPIDEREQIAESLRTTLCFGTGGALERLPGAMIGWVREARAVLAQIARHEIRRSQPGGTGLAARMPPTPIVAAGESPPTSNGATAPRDRTAAAIADQGLFNHQYYVAENRAVEAIGMDSFYYHITEGWKQGHDPSLQFSIRHYLHENPDVAASGHCPLLHYIFYGAAEERSPVPALDAARSTRRPCHSKSVTSGTGKATGGKAELPAETRNGE